MGPCASVTHIIESVRGTSGQALLPREGLRRQRHDRQEKTTIETEYKALLAKRDESRRKMLIEAIGKSRRTFDEVMNFIKG